MTWFINQAMVVCAFFNGFNLCVLYLALIKYMIYCNIWVVHSTFCDPALFICICFEATEFAPLNYYYFDYWGACVS